jgi:hypothetical protein
MSENFVMNYLLIDDHDAHWSVRLC